VTVTGYGQGMASTSPVYRSQAWKRLRLLALQRDGYVCCIRLPGCTGVATCVDHVMPLALAPDLALELENLRSSCQRCNAVLGSRLGNARKRARARARYRPAFGAAYDYRDDPSW